MTTTLTTRKDLLARAKELGLKGITRLSAEELTTRINAEEDRLDAENARSDVGPRGEILDRVGTIDEATGYEIRLPFREFEVMKRPAGVENGAKWLTRCVEHQADHPSDTATEAERAGARKARAGWCEGCAAKAHQAAA